MIKLKVLGPDARLVSTFDGLSQGLVTARQASKLWRNAVVENESPQLALARLDSGADALTTALAWKALAGAQPGQQLALSLMRCGQRLLLVTGLMLPLYAELVRESLTDETVAASMRFDDLGVAPKMACCWPSAHRMIPPAWLLLTMVTHFWQHACCKAFEQNAGR